METLLPPTKQETLQVSNFSSETKELAVYAADAAGDGAGGFFAKGVGQTSEDLAGWIDLPVRHLSLEPGESRILSVNFYPPQNAGVGLHTGAIIVRETKEKYIGEDTSRLYMEKGVRVYITIPARR